MNIDLPQSFSYESKNGYANVQENTLKIKGDVKFRSLMYELTYELKGKKCVYCGRPLKDGEETLDHGYPESMGGPTITNNLFPCCEKCNRNKNDYTIAQYEEFRKLETRQEQENFHSTVLKQQEKIRTTIGYDLPDEWLENNEREIGDILVRIDLNQGLSSNELRKTRRHYKKYGNICKPIIVDKNFVLLSGFKILVLCKSIGIDRDKLPIICINNVQVQI